MSYSAPALQRRRDGHVRSTRDAELPYLDHGAMTRNGSCDRVGGINLRQVAVLSKTDWEGIQHRLNKRQIEAERIRQLQEEKQRLHELSLERVKNWSNTVYGQRQKKLEDRRIRLEKEEEERKKIDIEEAKIQAEQRKAALEKAKLQQYYQTDRVKEFHSALLLTEVLKEREKQIELKKLKEDAAQSQDRACVEKIQREMEEIMRREEEEKAKVREDRFKNAEFQKAQARERRRQADLEKQDELTEAEHIKRLTAEFAEEERQKQLLRHEKAKQQAIDNRRQIEDVALMKQIDRMQEEEEDEECRLFANAKRKMMRMRAEKEIQLRNEKQAQLEIIRDRLRKQMEQKMSDEDSRISAAVAEMDANKAAEEREKEEKRAAMLRSIKDHRADQARRNDEQALREKREAIEAMKALEEAAMVYSANEVEKLRTRKENAKDLASIHLDQAEERRLREKMRQEQDEEYIRRNLELDDIQEAQFQAYARDVIDHCDKRGRNTHALRKVAAQVVPGRAAQRNNYVVSDQTGEQLPNFQTCGTDATKVTINGNNDSTKRLGFVW